MEFPSISRRPGNGPTHGLSRRGFLKALGTTGMVAAGGASLSACNSGASAGDMTFSLSTGGPINVMPSKKERKADAGTEAYAQALQDWLDEHPGVRLKEINVDVWDQQAMTTAIAGGTAPAAYVSNVIGSWNDEGIRTAFLQGLAADVTSLVEESGLEGRLADYAKPIWQNVWTLDGRHYAAPSSYNVGVGAHYRRDLIEEMGLEEPQIGWTWLDLAALAKGLTTEKRKGFAGQTWVLNQPMYAEGFGMLTDLPDPTAGLNYRYDYTSLSEHWIGAVDLVRRMRFEDKSTLSDISMLDGDVVAAFTRQDVAMHINSVVFYSAGPQGTTGAAVLADRLERPVEEVVGWIQLPVGINGFGSTGMSSGQIDATSFSPDLNDDELATIFSLHMHMLGPGFVTQKQAVYEETDDLRMVYDYANITPVLADTLDKLPGSPEEAWGEKFMEAVQAAAAIELMPEPVNFIPPEEAPGPTEDALSDAQTRWWYERGDLDVAADLRKLERVRNAQAEGFSSSISDEDFVEGAKDYYAAHDEFWREHSPRFHAEIWTPWYDRNVRDALG